MKITTIAESCTLHARIGWQGLTKKEYLNEGDYYLVTGVDFCNGHIDFKNCHYVTKDRYDQDKHIQIHEGDVLVTKDGTIGKVAIIDEPVDKPATLNSGVFVVRPKNENELLPRYLVYVLLSNHFSRFIEQIKVGCTIAHLNQEKFLKYEFPLPTIEEQMIIIELFDNLSTVLGQRTEQIRLLDELIKARFVELFGNIDNPKWTSESFESKVYFQEGPGVRKWQFRTGGIKLINIKNIVNDKLDLSNTDKYLSIDEVNEKYKHFLLNPGDYVMASSGVTWGKIAEVNTEHLPLCLNTSMIRLVPKEGIIKQYLFYFIKSDFFRNQIERLITGSAQPNFGPSHLMKVEIPVPPINVQEQFAKEVQQVDKSKVVVQKALDEAQLLFDSLMQQYFG